MPDLNDVIAGALAESSEEPEVQEGAAEVETAAPEAAVETVAEVPAVAAKEESGVDDIDKLLEEHGLKRGKGVKENLIPYTRVKKMVGNQIKKLTDTHTGELSKRDSEIQSARARLADYDRHDKLVKEDADRYMELLSTLHPQYKRFLQNPAAVVPEARKSDAADFGDMPKPADPSGYTEAELQKLMLWSISKAEANLTPKIEARLNERFKPFDDVTKARELLQQEAPKIREQINDARDRWGAMLDTHQKEILTALAEHPKKSFEAVVAMVLVPKLKGDRDTIRKEVLEEAKAASKGVTPSGGGAGIVKAEPSRPKTSEEVIAEVLAARA